MLDLVIKNGTVVNHDSSVKADVGIKDGKVVVLGDASTFAEARKTIDATGKYVMPGMIDSHVHLNQNMGEFTTLGSLYEGSIAAVYGGTTSMIDFAIPDKSETPVQAMERRKEEAKGQSLIDYSFHSCITNGTAENYQAIEDLISDGIPTIKMFTVYSANMVGTGEILEVLKIINQKGGMAHFHSESAGIIDYTTAKYVSEKKTTPKYHALSKPPVAEFESMASLISLIEHTDAPALFLHLCNHETKSLLETYRHKLPIYTEVCPAYLALTDDVYDRPDGQNFVCSPPIRSKEIQDGLWELIREGYVDVVNSDHCDFNLEQKAKYKDDFTKMPNGLPGIETRGILLYSEGVAKDKITVNEFVDLTSTKVAKLMGMYPNKGLIRVGSDADVVVYDPEVTYQIKAEDLHMQGDYSPFEDLPVTGKPIHTIVHGEHVIENGKLINDQTRGEFIKRSQPIL